LADDGDLLFALEFLDRLHRAQGASVGCSGNKNAAVFVVANGGMTLKKLTD
jgi:hypothetical protein